jgi:hypothetical protein
MMPPTTALRPFTAPSAEYDDGQFFPSEDGPNELGADAPLVARRLIREALADCFALDLGVYVGAGVPVYAGGPTRGRLCTPDALVVLGARQGEWAAWCVEREGLVPTVCVDVGTRVNRAHLLGAVKGRLERLGVKEYLIFHPDRVIGFRLRAGRYQSIRPGADGGIRSRLLGLRLVSEYGYPRFVDMATGEVVLTRREQALRSAQAKRANPTVV